VATKGATAGSRPGRGADVRIRNPWGQGDRLRGDILAAAARLLGELGTVEGLTLRGVARRAGVAPASIYAHFADKSALVDALLAYEHEQVVELMRQAEAQTDPADPVGRVRSQLYAFCRYSLASPGHYRVMFGSQPGQHNYARVLVDRLATTLSENQGEGTRLRLPADRAAIVLLVGAHGRVAISHAQPEIDTEDKVLQFVDELVSLVYAPS
jgi:AcrR family transcriptional regulator